MLDDALVKVRLHFALAAGSTTGCCTTSCTTGCKNVYTLQPDVQIDVQLAEPKVLNIHTINKQTE